VLQLQFVEVGGDHLDTIMLGERAPAHGTSAGRWRLVDGRTVLLRAARGSDRAQCEASPPDRWHSWSTVARPSTLSTASSSLPDDPERPLCTAVRAAPYPLMA
jgi:hypothetical protein